MLLATSLKETRPAEHRVGSSFGGALAGYRFLMGDRNFLGLTFIGGFGIASFFVYLASSSFVLIDHYGLSPSVYSVFFSINAVAFIGMSQLTGMLTERFGLRRVVRVAVVGYATTMVALLAVMASGVDQLDVLAALLFVGYGFLGLVIPTTSVLAMEEHGEIAGTASALMGTLHFATGAVAMAVAGIFFDGTPLPMVIGIAACAVIAFVLTQITLGRGARSGGSAGRVGGPRSTTKPAARSRGRLFIGRCPAESSGGQRHIAGHRQYEPHSHLDGCAGYLDQFMAEIAINRGDRVEGAHGFVEILLSLGVLTKNLGPRRQ